MTLRWTQHHRGPITCVECGREGTGGGFRPRRNPRTGRVTGLKCRDTEACEKRRAARKEKTA